MSPSKGDTPNARRRMQPERLALLIQTHQEASRSHHEEQEAHEAIISLLQEVKPLHSLPYRSDKSNSADRLHGWTSPGTRLV